MKVRITMTEEMLGTKAANKDIFTDFIASKCPNEDLRKQELDTVEHREESGTTIFHRHPETGELMLWDYQVKGFLKNAADIHRQTGDDYDDEGGTKKKGKKWGSAKSKFDNFVFVFPRMITLGKTVPDGICERPLRAQTMQGPRVSLARSEVVSSGTSFECDIKILPGGPVSEDMIRQCLDYGQYSGIGQWRNSGKGRFVWEEINGVACGIAKAE